SSSASDKGSPRSISSIMAPMRSMTASTVSTSRRSGTRRPARASDNASSAAWLRASSLGKSKKPQLPLTVWTKRKMVSSRARSVGSASQATISPESAASISRVSATNSASRSSIAPSPNLWTVYASHVVKSALRKWRPGAGSAARNDRFLFGDEFNQRRLTGFDRRNRAVQGRDDLDRVGDPFAMAAERAGEGGVIAGNVGGAILVRRHRHDRQLNCHRLVVEQDREDRDALARRGLEVGPGKPDRGITPDVDAQLVRARELRAHREPKAVAELRRLTPADVAVRTATLPKRHQLVTRTASVVGDDRVRDVDGLLQIPQHAIRRNRAGFLPTLPFPFRKPSGFGLLDAGRDFRAVAIIRHPPFYCFDQRRQRQPGIANQRHFARHRLVDIERVQRRMNHALAHGNR